MASRHVVRVSSPHPPLPRLSVLLLAGLVAAGCGKDDVVTGPGTPPPTLSQIWPNEDGRGWTYRLVLREWDPPPPVVFASAALVPSVTFNTVAGVFASRSAGSNPTTDTVSVLLRFNGVTTLPSGVEAQLLEQIIQAPGVGSRSSDARVTRRQAPFDGLDGSGPARQRADDRLSGLLGGAEFVRGGLWRRTSQWVGTHSSGDLDTLPDWKFLEADLTTGRTFELALIPDLAPDVLLHGRIVRSLTVQTPAGPVSNGIEVHYFVDYGVSIVTDDQGAILGAAREFTYASVLYAPGIGPVRSDERARLYAGASSRLGAGDRLLELIESTTGGTSIATR